MELFIMGFQGYVVAGVFVVFFITALSGLPFHRVITTSVGAVIGVGAIMVLAHYTRLFESELPGAFWAASAGAALLGVILIGAFSLGDPIEEGPHFFAAMGIIAVGGFCLLLGQLVVAATCREHPRPMEIPAVFTALIVGSLLPVFASGFGLLLGAGPRYVVAAISGND